MFGLRTASRTELLKSVKTSTAEVSEASENASTAEDASENTSEAEGSDVVEEIAAENDAFTPISCAQKLTKTIPNSELMVLADGSHAALIEQPQTINFRIDRFVRDHSLLRQKHDS